MSDLPIAISTGPSTRSCTHTVCRLLVAHGRLFRFYEADGNGGRALEADVLAGRILAVMDLTLTEIAAEMLGKPGGAGPDRLTAAASRGIPQVIALGGLDPADSPGSTPEDYDRLGREIAIKASAARGPTILFVPSRSVSPVLVESLRNWISPNVPVRELELHVNDPAFASAALHALPL